MIEIIENYVDERFEDEVLKLVPKRTRVHQHRNQILRWGSRVPYDNFIVSEKIPPVFDIFRKDIEFDSVTVNEYLAGQKIDWHIDAPKAGNVIYVVSLLSSAAMMFRKDNNEVYHGMPRYSLTKFWGELRNEWEHSVVCQNRRISIVLRNSKEIK